MTELEFKVPPDLVALVVAGLMWLVSAITPSVAIPGVLRVPIVMTLTAGGIVLIFAARVEFARAATTFSPVAPDRSSSLVTSGVYRFSRNPMYLGTLLLLLAFAAWLSDPVSALVAMSYAAYIDRFQIRPEERVLLGRFGSEYEDYARLVRRWA
jgi:protein-S-isoprenylcysteine O-methyltransferase Ste14